MDRNDRDYSKEDYAPRDPIEAIYDTKTKLFSFKHRSQIISDIKKEHLIAVPNPRFKRTVTYTSFQRADISQGFIGSRTKIGILKLSPKVWIGRNILGKFREVYVFSPGS
ncbi:hypothetical protein VTL71DRAFT_4881 [Oculimacula yallundae]|uniref:Uncharacterized protein n=1 Tax=Oculimacula yallundae TaxID=86028 RepID=A0ABR4C382_9HELO